MTMSGEARRQLAGLAAAGCALVALAVALDLAGRTARRTLPGHQVVTARGGADVLAAWRSAGVRGRTVLWMARDLAVVQPREPEVAAHLRDPLGEGRADDENFLYLAMRENLVRRVVYVVPDDRWDAYRRAARDRSELHPQGSGLVQFIAGVPVEALPARLALATGRERALVYLSPETGEFFGPELSARLESDPAFADLVVVRAAGGTP
jgi:hypothetical protein